MDLKAIDLQFAVHKSSDAGQTQHQLQSRAAHEQAHLGTAAQRTAEQLRQAPAKTDKPSGTSIRERQQRQSGGRKQSEAERMKSGETAAGNREPAQATDPYKGRHIDLSL